MGLFAACGLMTSACKKDEPEAKPELTPVAANSAPLRALTPTEYNNSVRDLFGFSSQGNAWPKPPEAAARISPPEGERAGLFGAAAAVIDPWPWAFPEEAGVEHFEGMADGQVPSAYQLEELQRAANHFAAYALVSPVFFTCNDWSTKPKAEQAACAWASIERFAQRAWRRPITEEERTRLRTFWELNWSEGIAEEAVALTVSGILQTPAFLYRAEFGKLSEQVGNAIPLTGWEMASRLSYFFWDSIPDVPLFAAAARNELSTKEQVEAHARRMLQDARARRSVVHFHEQWLETKQVRTISPARRVFGPAFGISPEPPLDTTGDGDWPAFLGPLRYSLEAETQLFVENIVFNQAGTLKALLTDNTGFMSDRTAPLYGPDAQKTGDTVKNLSFDLVVFSMGRKDALSLYPAEFPTDQRAGVLTHPSVLSVGAYTVQPAPIIRGKRLLERVACQHFGSPPPGAEGEIPPDTEAAAATNRKRTEDATQAANCAVCHNQLNPPGFAYESYDAMGRFRTEDNGAAVDSSGSFTLQNGESFTFNNGVELAKQLSESPQVQNCYVQRWVNYATGIQIDREHVELSRLQSEFRENDHVQDLLVSITSSDLFRYRNAGGAQ